MSKEEKEEKELGQRAGRIVECINCGKWLNRRQEFCPKCEYPNSEYYKPARIERLTFVW